MKNFNDALRKILEKLHGWLEQLVIMLPNLLVAIIFFVIFFLIGKYFKKIVYKTFAKATHSSALIDLMINVVFFIFILIGLFIALSVLQLDTAVTSLLAGAGILGLALGFAFQDIAANFVAGVLIAMRKPIIIDDLIQSNDHFGTVININLRSTIIRTPQGQHVFIPNKDLFSSPIINYSNEGIRRVDLDVGISYGEDLEKVKRVTMDAISSLDYILEDPKSTLVFTEFGDSSINFTVRYWIKFHKQIDYRQALSDGIMSVKAAYDKHDIMIPFPIRTLDFGIKGGEKLDSQIKSLTDKNKIND
ncbi:MAG: mechanosensitive ion channel family protein [Bacteroidia bacterium]